MSEFYNRALEMKDEFVQIRRHFHMNPERGLDLPKTVDYVMEQLKSWGYDPKPLGKGGVVATAGGKKPGKVIMLRGDMDALPMTEEADIPFASTNGFMHACGHDMHTTMLLGAAKMLKEKEDELEGTVKFMFQPGEEIFAGAQEMLNHGILENPKVDVALGLHVFSGDKLDVGNVYYGVGNLEASCDGFEITVHGKGSHGALPQMSIDPINVAAHIHTALQEIIAREVNPGATCVITVGQLLGGTANNIIPPTATLRGTVRSFSDEDRKLMVQRLPEVAENIAKAFRATAEVKWDYNIPALGCDETLTNEFLGYLKDMPEDVKFSPSWPITGSEDFALVSEKVPSAYMILGANVEGAILGQHHPKVQFHEDVMPIGMAIYAECAYNWLKNHK